MDAHLYRELGAALGMDELQPDDDGLAQICMPWGLLCVEPGCDAMLFSLRPVLDDPIRAAEALLKRINLRQLRTPVHIGLHEDQLVLSVRIATCDLNVGRIAESLQWMRNLLATAPGAP
ncbi:MAG: hypothetical protein Q7T63_14200 [Burkholderiaceae bacterium]|nr:hypothetical protein [Burkholderiaceae bacterium]